MAPIFSLLTLLPATLLAVLAKADDVFFLETFDGVDPFVQGRWKASKEDQYKTQQYKLLPSQNPATGFENDKGLQLTLEMKHYGLGTVFPRPLSFREQGEVVIQYELKFEEAFNCGGAYIKLLRETSDGEGVDMEKLKSSSPYTIMFGPDRCGATNKIHFILQYQHPGTKTWEEKHYNTTIPVKVDKETHLYSLVLKENNDFEIFVDGEEAKTGSLLTHFNPPINPPELIDDPTDIKPADWVDVAKIDDPEAVKPEEWDENEPKKIPDPTAKKPDDWDDDALTMIPDPNANKPEDWDDEEDGEWEAPLVPNPVCEKSGCGPWSPPTIANPKYKGKWTAPKIPNPEYRGPWSPRKVPNPDYFFEASPFHQLAPIQALAIEIWTTNAGIHLDNFLLATSKATAQEYTKKTFFPKSAAEKQKKKDNKRAEKMAELQETIENGSFFDKINAYVLHAALYAQDNPIILAITGLAIIIPFLYILMFGGRGAKDESAEEEKASEDQRPEESQQKEEQAKSSDDSAETSTGEEKKTTESK